MFHSATTFNRDVSSWDVSAVTGMNVSKLLSDFLSHQHVSHLKYIICNHFSIFDIYESLSLLAYV